MNIRFIPRNLDEVKKFLRTVPRGGLKVGLRALTEYLIGNQRHGLKHYSPYKYVSRKAAYGKTFVSDKQRRYVMAAIRDGRIDPGVPHRTGRGQRGWVVIETQRGYTIRNDEPSMFYSMADDGQARLNAKAGWRTVTKNIADNMAGALRHATAVMKQYFGNR